MNSNDVTNFSLTRLEATEITGLLEWGKSRLANIISVREKSAETWPKTDDLSSLYKYMDLFVKYTAMLNPPIKTEKENHGENI